MKSWTVFKQDSNKKPHQMVGSVYAVDAETALLEARTVFARRPKAVSMWVAPTETLVSWTKEQLVTANAPAAAATQAEESMWQVFRKVGQRRAMTFVDHVGDVVGNSAENALAQARTQFDNGKTVWVWMLIPDNAIARSNDEDIESWFKPALSKTYKQQSQYGFVGGKRAKKGT
ncbi:MAG: phenylacetic acid degradation protein [Candidatus Promineifilaceae bacterium]